MNGFRIPPQWRPLRVAGLWSALGLFWAPVAFGGNVKFDGSMGRGGALPGPNFLIPAEAGKQAGGNLFHSFSNLDLSAGDVASFQAPLAAGAPRVGNILARVTGGASSIDGTLRSEISGANLYLINPAGVVFGANAKVDVSGSFTVTTANHLKLADGGRFDASAPAADILTAAPVSAFGFVSATPAAVSFNSSILNVAAGKSFSVIAGDVLMNGVDIRGVDSRFELVAVASAGEALVPADPTHALDTSGFAFMGETGLRNFSLISARGPDGGKVVVRSGSLVIEDSSLVSYTTGDPRSRGGAMDVAVRGTLRLTNGTLGTGVLGSGIAGDISVLADSVELFERSFLSSTAFADATSFAAAGNVKIDSTFVTVRGASEISASTYGAGAGGNVFVTSSDVLVQDALSSISSQAFASGPTGKLELHTGFLTILDGGTIGTITFDTGHGGDVFITAEDTYISNLAGASAGATGILATSEAEIGGDSGSIRVESPILTIRDSGVISSVTRGLGRGGSVTVIATDTLISGGDTNKGTGIFAASEGSGFGGQSGNVNVDSTHLTILRGGQISANTFSLAAGGDVTVRADDIYIDSENVDALTGISADSQSFEPNGGRGGNVSVVAAESIGIYGQGSISATTFGGGQGGNVSIDAGGISLAGEGPSAVAGIYAASNSSGAGGHGGSVLISSDNLSITDGARISVSTHGFADAGDLIISTGNLFITTRGPTSAPGLFAETTAELGGGNAGSIRISADDVSVIDGGKISAITFGAGRGGDITLDSRNVLVSGAVTGINAATSGTGAGGNIRVNASHFEVSLGALVSSATLGDGNGGALLIKAGALSLVDGGIIVASTFAAGSGGNVKIESNRIRLTNAHAEADAALSAILAESDGLGKAGSLSINTGRLDIFKGGRISVSASNEGNAGDLLLNARQITIDRAGSGFFTGIAADTSNVGQGGTIRLQADTLTLRSGGLISTSTFGPGNAGDIKIKARSVNLDGAFRLGAGDTSGGISVSSRGEFATGHGGNIHLDTGRLTITDGASISARTTGPGDGGSISLRAGSISLDRGGLVESSSIAGGLAGRISIGVDERLSLTAGSALRTTSAQTSAGLIEVRSGSEIILNGSEITVQALRGDAGQISLRAPRLIYLLNSALSAEAGNNGGNVFIDPEFLILNHSTISANAIAGRGGNIQIIAGTFLQSESAVTASSEQSVQGTVSIQSPEVDLSGAVVTLSSSLLDVSNRFQEQCARRLGMDFSSLLVLGRGGVPPAPDEPQRNAIP